MRNIDTLIFDFNKHISIAKYTAKMSKVCFPEILKKLFGEINIQTNNITNINLKGGAIIVSYRTEVRLHREDGI